MQVAESMIHDMVDAIVEEVHPDRVYLFGSQSTGDSGWDSDVDLLVVRDEAFDSGSERWRAMQQIRKALRPFRIAKDILVYSRSEFQDLRRSQHHVVGHIARNGTLLYERH